VIGEPVDIIHPGTRTDGYGNTQTDWDAGTTVTVRHAGFAPSGNTEDTNRRDAVTAAPTVYLPAGTDVDSTCRVVVRGLTYEATGDPADWRNPLTGLNAGLALALRRVEG
jgi:hypothetical protein